MFLVNVYFKNYPPLEIKLNNNTVAEKMYALSKKHYEMLPTVFRDPLKYNVKYLEQLAIEANSTFNWNWKTSNITDYDTIEMHKDLENVLNDEGDFRRIPKQYHHLIHELHYCLHRVQFKSEPDRIGYFQIEWFTGEYVPLDEDFSFTNDLNFGDLILLNPFVGHNPLKCYNDDDYDDINRTCRIPTRIKSGIVMYTIGKAKEINMEDYTNWWFTKGKSVVDTVGFDTILRFTGEGKIGEVVNKDLLQDIINDPNELIFDKLEFLN